jgi:exopolyphosphatase/guanosine-5'-triphosphate,3'-diphosphate pyrophosphatase
MITIDLGSNTIRFLEFDCETKQKIKASEKIIKTADGLIHTGKISDDAIDRVVEAINEAKDFMDFNQKIKACTTEAIRKASNQIEVIEKIKEKTEVEFEIIDGELEAYYTAKAVEFCLNDRNIKKDFFLIDIGGGSTELTFKSKGAFISKSFELGIVTLSQKHLGLNALKMNIKKEAKELKEFINMGYMRFKKPSIFVASSGTPTTIAALKIGLDYSTYDSDKVNGVEITEQDLDYWLDILIKSDAKAREKMVGTGRGDLIMSGIIIYKEIFRLTGYDTCIVCDDGLREGIAFSECE